MALLSLGIRKKIGEISTIEAQAQAHAGLRIVIVEVSQVDDEYSNTIVVKSGLKSLTRTPFTSSSSSSSMVMISTSSSNGGDFDCFLKSCNLCKKPLSPDKDVYMYRGDQGFCSIQCRSRQIKLDEMKEMDEQMKKMRKLKDDNASYSTKDCAGCETCRLLEDLRKRRFQRNANKFKPANPLFSAAKHQQPLLSFS